MVCAKEPALNLYQQWIIVRDSGLLRIVALIEEVILDLGKFSCYGKGTNGTAVHFLVARSLHYIFYLI